MTADSQMDRSLSARVADIRGRLDADSHGAAGSGSTPRAGGREKGGREGTAPGRPPPRRRRRLISPLTRRILTLNVLVLMIPVLGLLHLDQYRQSLISIRASGRGSSAAPASWSPIPSSWSVPAAWSK